ncbi:MAG TPA: hypothetical protein VK427_24665, partial [Kofleriaceae bacterium]|nr:hypothetical protein [Kofleriaceae bacterium]
NGYWEEPVRMRGAIEIVGALAARDLYNTAALAALAPLVQAAGERPRVVLDTGARVVVSAEDRGDDLVMVARVDDPVELAAMTIEVTNGRADEATRLPQGAQLHLAGVGTGTLSLGSALTFAWKTIEVPPAQLRAGASLLGAIAAQGGVYR